ncbi:hypothetical protein PHLGIDRAFT_130053 [Phlebiopsis gigantea 11061_1 CR5-6]|uniref:Uncharacterized protein n=1 Tax=Phlebiopsis gigantea (strain 11061_1 CR5-6) TaxID=745531 RepID=A0A0C3PDW0_PHLG1|nr:hypothetical protein PHLGIDRAFT_130053 [Phlebiopsis gigantea 11061_1 CR5-6]
MSSIRHPRHNYRKTNGFIDPTAQEISEVAAISAPQVASTAQSAAEKTHPGIRDLVSVHRATEDMLEIKGSYFPGLEAMQDFVEKPESYESVRAHVKQLETQHEQEVAQLLDLQTRDYLLSRVDAYHTADSGVDLPEVDMLLDFQTHPGTPELSAMESEYETYRYLHLRALAGWTKRRDELRTKEDSERKERDARFPQSIAEFNTLSSKDVQVRVARFLLATSAEKERMCGQFGWAYRQVKPLEGDFERNADADADALSEFNVVFQADVRRCVREGEARDPRRTTS